MIHDVYLETAPDTDANFPYEPYLDLSADLSAVPQDVIDELPEECQITFAEARDAKFAYRSKWGTERDDGQRAEFLPTTVWFP